MSPAIVDLKKTTITSKIKKHINFPMCREFIMETTKVMMLGFLNLCLNNQADNINAQSRSSRP